ncbi:protein of unknown function (plasmid) [Pararobbsia alpina]
MMKARDDVRGVAVDVTDFMMPVIGGEALVCAMANDPRLAGRTQTWLKAKARLRQELVTCGFTARGRTIGEIASLLSSYDGGKLHDAGSIGADWNTRTARDLWARLAPLETTTSPCDVTKTKTRSWSRRAAAGERWVKPRLVAEIEFAEWTAQGVVRQGSSKGRRLDKPANAMVREGGKTSAPQPMPALKITHAERIIDSSADITKADLVRYYASVAERVLPHLAHRPVALVCAPAGIAGRLFSQNTWSGPACPG